MAVIPVDLGGRSYDVLIGASLLEDAGKLLAPLLRDAKACVVADAGAWAAQGARFSGSLEAAGFGVAVRQIAAGEGSKSWESLRDLVDWLLSQGVERGDNVIAFGGGMVGDLTGFASAVLKRGCGFIQVPTTLLAQVDSSVGGKTAINTGAGKNLVGAFHQPSLVMADTSALASLPEREMRAGYAEVLKYGILGDRSFFDWLETGVADILAHESGALQEAVSRSVAAKARIVSADERETGGQRAILNLGHTFGHALEAATGFSERLLHGEGVALGMVLAARYSARRGHLTVDDAERIADAVSTAGLASEIASLGLACDGQRLAAHMLHDKKMEAGTLTFVLLRQIGEAYLARDVEMADIAAFLDEQLRVH